MSDAPELSRMETAHGTLGLPAYRAEPPYERLEPAYPCDLRPAGLRPGTVLAVRVSGSAREWAELPEVMGSLGRRLPAAALVLWLSTPPAADLGHLALRATAMGARALLVDPGDLREILSRSLTQPLDLGAEVVGWLDRRGIRLSPMLTHLIRQIFARAPHHAELSGLLREIGESETTTRFRFRKKALPSPHCWHQAARALHTALRIQAEPERGLLDLALALGYCDHSAASKLLFRALRLRPAAIRGTLGWEWMLDRWVSRMVPARVGA